MNRALPFFVLALAGCAFPGQPYGAQSVAKTVSLAKASITACSGKPSADGVINYDTIAASGWKIQSRTTRLDADDYNHALDSSPVLRPGEYESTIWTHPAHKGELGVTRSDVSDISLMGQCSILMVVEDADAVRAVTDSISKIVARPIDRQGELPMGGDWLLPRFGDDPSTGFYWQMPQHDVYAIVTDDSAIRLEIVAMPDRSKLDEYSYDNPENRVPSGK